MGDAQRQFISSFATKKPACTVLPHPAPLLEKHRTLVAMIPDFGDPCLLHRTCFQTGLPPTIALGFPTDLWTHRRLAALIEQRWGIHFNANYLVEWLQARERSAQKPAQPAKERDQTAIAPCRTRTGRACKKTREKKRLTSW